MYCEVEYFLSPKKKQIKIIVVYQNFFIFNGMIFKNIFHWTFFSEFRALSKPMNP